MVTERNLKLPLPVAVIGAGRMGGHHARIYASLPEAHLVGIVDTELSHAQSLAQQYHSVAFPSVAALLAACPDLRAASIATPTIYHRAIAENLLQRGMDTLIEKPLAPTVADAEALVTLARQHQCVLQVGHSERFNPVVRALSGHQLDPRFIEVHRISPMRFRSVDIGVVLDLMIHDIDIVHHFVRSPVSDIAAVGVAVIGQHEDVANARIVFANGCVANITASRLAMKTERRMRLFSPNAYVSVDYQKKAGVIITKTANQAQLDLLRQKLAAEETPDLSNLDYTELVHVDQLDIDDQEPLRLQLQSFLQAVRTGAEPVVTGADGTFAVDVASRITAAIAWHQWVGLDGAAVSVSI
ncbi:MAG: Gfo/Idh/MocA family oxidoreductase [Planctomycetia bacterium]|nr:Gfo/Idh/MocA family oxidoreductase [Planctomycetia bacterium]